MIWQGDEESLHQFIGHLNENDRNIKLTYMFDSKQISFLDLQIKLEGDSQSTYTFRKKTAANTLLRADSHHPK